MDTLLHYVPDALAALAAAWQWRKARRAAADKVAIEAARAALASRLERVSDIAAEFADALARHDYPTLHRIEERRKREGL